MSSHMTPVPPANRSPKGPSDDPKVDKDTSLHHPKADNAAEQGETANVKQNTTNKGYFAGRRVKWPGLSAHHLNASELRQGVLWWE